MQKRARLGRALILLGVLAWVPYAAFRYGLGWDVPLGPFLSLHLAGVIPGSVLLRWDQLRRLMGLGDDGPEGGS
jgi:hypothetical protein